MDSQEAQDKEAAADPPAHQDLPDQLDSQEAQEAQDSQDSPVNLESRPPAAQGQKDHPAQLETQEAQDNLEALDNPVALDPPDPLDNPVNQEAQEEMASQDRLEAMDSLVQMLHTALVPPAPQCSSADSLKWLWQRRSGFGLEKTKNFFYCSYFCVSFSAYFIAGLYWNWICGPQGKGNYLVMRI